MEEWDCVKPAWGQLMSVQSFPVEDY
jgi:hypothetical protein